MARMIVKKIRFTERDLRRIERKALTEGLNFSEYLRLHTSGGTLRFSELIEFINNITVDINKIGKRINKIVIHSNQSVMVTEEKTMLNYYLKEINLKLDKAMELYDVYKLEI